MTWAALSWSSLGPVIALYDHITSNKYEAILHKQVHIMQTLFSNDVLFAFMAFGKPLSLEELPFISFIQLRVKGLV